MLEAMFLLFSALLMLGSLFLSVRGSRGIQTQERYFFDGRNLGALPLFMSLLATQIGGGTIVGAAEAAYARGWSAGLYPLGNCLGLLLLAILGPRLRRLRMSTMAEMFERNYRSVLLRKIASLLSMASLFLILIGQAVAVRKLLISLGFPEGWMFLSFWTVLTTYTMQGGLRGVVRTDMLQTTFMLAGLCVTACLFWKNSQGRMAPPPLSFSGELPWSSWLLMPALFTLIEQETGQRCFAARSDKAIAWSMSLSALVLFLATLVPILFGVVAKNAGLTAPSEGSILVTSILHAAGSVPASLFNCVILVAIISTANSLLNAIGSSVCLDFFPRSGLLVTRVWTSAIGMAALACVSLCGNIVFLIVLAYEFSVCTLLVPLLMGVLLRRPEKSAAIWAMVGGGCGCALFQIWQPPWPKEIASLALSALGFAAGQMYARIKHLEAGAL
jgi:SSS family solute:Na+ symporter